MKKRIICLILAVVMLSLSLVGCVYSYEDDELDAYVTYDEAAFVAAMKNLVIVGGDFTEDAETRANKVYDAIYSLLASNATNTDKKNTGKPADHDKFYYCYYITFEKDGKTVQLAPDYMATGKAKSFQLGQKIYSAKLDEEISKIAKDFEFTAENAYSQDSSTANKVEAGQFAAITYSYSYDSDPAEDKETLVKGTVTLQLVTLDSNNPLHAKLIGKNINTEFSEKVTGDNNTETTVKEIVIPKDSGFVINGEEVNAEIKVTGAKVAYVVKGTPLTTVVDKTYSEEPSTALKDIYGNEHKVKDVDLTYHVYANAYSVVDELDATNIIKLIYGKNLTKDTLKNMIILGAELSEKTEEEQAAYFENNFKINGLTANEGSTVFDTLADKLVTALSDVATKKSTLTTAESAETKAQTDYNEAAAEVKEKPDSEAAKEELKEAEKTLNEKKEAVNKAKTAYDEAVDTRDELIVALLTKDYMAVLDAKDAYKAAATEETAKKDALDKAKEDEAKKKTEAEKEGATDEAKAAYETAKQATATAQAAYDTAKQAADAAKDKYKNPAKESIEGVNDIIVNGYEDVKYKELQDAYRADKKEKIVKAVFEEIKKNVKVNAYPEKAVDEAYDRIINNYKYSFYNGKAADSNGNALKDEDGVEITNYTYFKGSFKNYLIAAVTTDYATVETYKEAKEAVRAWAQEKVAPVLQFSFIADKYDLVYTDAEFKEYKKDKNNGYESDEFYYGESTVRNGLQFAKLMDYFLESEEKVDENDSRFVTDEYKNIKVVPKFD